MEGKSTDKYNTYSMFPPASPTEIDCESRSYQALRQQYILFTGLRSEAVCRAVLLSISKASLLIGNLLLVLFLFLRVQ
jgi:hypothetical protein